MRTTPTRTSRRESRARTALWAFALFNVWGAQRGLVVEAWSHVLWCLVFAALSAHLAWRLQRQ